MSLSEITDCIDQHSSSGFTESTIIFIEHWHQGVNLDIEHYLIEDYI